MALKVVQVSAFSGLVNGVQVGKTPAIHFGAGPDAEKLAAEFGGLFYRLLNKQMPPGCPHHNPA
jgi:hypothetical protein